MEKDKKLYDKILSDVTQLSELLQRQLATANQHLSSGNQEMSEIFYERSRGLLRDLQNRIDEFEEENALLKEKR